MSENQRTHEGPHTKQHVADDSQHYLEDDTEVCVTVENKAKNMNHATAKAFIKI